MKRDVAQTEQQLIAEIEALRRQVAELQETKTSLQQVQEALEQRQRAEAALRESEARFRNAFRYAPIGIAVVNLEGRFLQVNHPWCEILGYSEQELTALTFQAVSHPDDLAENLSHTRQLLAGEINAFQMEKRYFHKLGQVVWGLLSVSLVRDPNGQPLYFIAQIEDVTERKQAEQALQRYTRRLTMLRELDQAILAVQAPEAIAQAALHHVRRLVPCLRASLVVFDFETDEAILLASNVKGETRVEAGQRFPLAEYGLTETLRQKQVYMVEDILALSQPGSVNQTLRDEGVRSFISVPLFAQGQLIGSLNLGAANPNAFVPEYVDIAREAADGLALAIQNARLFADLRQAQTQLVQRERLAALGQLAATVAHEMRNPLMAIRMGVEYLLRDVSADDPRQRGATLMQANMDRIDRIVENILFISRAPEPRLVPGRLRPLIEAEAARWELLLAEKQISLELKLAPDLPALALDTDQMARALSNLISNSVDSLTPGGELSLTLSQNDRHQVITLVDNGPGIPAEHLPRVFEPFFTTKSRGTGLGLSIVKQIIDHHHGAVDVWSELGLGTKFTITLPVTGFEN